MRPRRGLTLAEVIIVILLVGLLAGIVLPMVFRQRETTWYPAKACMRRNLRSLARGMALYLNDFGDNRWYACPLGRGTLPGEYNGAEWLATLYWVGVVADPTVFLCPLSDDTNHGGFDLGSRSAVPGRFGSQTVSYAGMHWRSLTDRSGRPTTGAVADDFPPNMPMASDDTQGSINHGRRDSRNMSVLFFDSHAEVMTADELDLRKSVGQAGGLLWQLRN
ncbi:MAG: type II secretion system protein [Planctomycetota bacterium]